MADIAIWNGSATFVSGSSTPFGFYDSDPIFAADAVKVAKFCATRLGYPLMDVELQSGSFFACFEEAVTTYGNEVYQYKIRENYLNLEGSSTELALNNRVVQPSLDRIVQISNNYGTEAGVGGTITKRIGKLPVKKGQQSYDLSQWAVDNGIDGGIEIRRVFYEAPPAIVRYFDPYAGTGTGVQSLMDAFDFGSFSPGINFLLMPASFDILKIQAIEFNDQIRRSSYSFELQNNQLQIFPLPKADYMLRFEYFLLDDRKANSSTDGTGLVTTVSNVPYENPEYGKINSVGRQWVYSYTLALAKELLGYVRGKYTQIPIPGSETTLNQSDLLTDARTEKERLVVGLREMLDQSSRHTQLERKANETENLNKTLVGVPMPIYIG